MSMKLLIEQYRNQLNKVNQQIRQMEKDNKAREEPRKYKQLKQMRGELETSISQMKRYL